jgi:hypothetical protein
MRNQMCPIGLRLASLALAAGASAAAHAQCVPVPATLQQATATYSQTCGGGNPVVRAIDNNFGTGWAIYQNTTCGSAEFTFDQTAAFEVAGYLGESTLGEPYRIAISTLTGGFWGSSYIHTLGLFRLSVTGDDRATFADGLSANGDVTANWTVLVPDSIRAVVINNVTGADMPGAATTLTVRADGSILASGINPENVRYEIIATSPIPVVTGVRLEVFDSNGASSTTDLGLPTGGPGRAVNGNFVLREFRVGRAACLEICTQPASAFTGRSGIASTTIGGAGVGTLGHSWQVADPAAPGGWRVLTDGGLTIGADHIGTITGSSTAQVSAQFDPDFVQSITLRCNVSNVCGSVTSTNALLRVCIADFNLDNTIDFFDYLDFVADFSSNEPSADFNLDQVIDFFDYLDFVAEFSVGC